MFVHNKPFIYGKSELIIIIIIIIHLDTRITWYWHLEEGCQTRSTRRSNMWQTFLISEPFIRITPQSAFILLNILIRPSTAQEHIHQHLKKAPHFLPVRQWFDFSKTFRNILKEFETVWRVFKQKHLLIEGVT